ncbi:translation elongation factor Ts [Bdellovibrio bacteriovorus]|uniref:Elongation factor Ts n=1 Tax=Bdellovibrio bacteriovorus (strain ATCC 15356 / DSM 50701 / NCIMB 9529 / HD100) TaxID=264462 RepID=EFTS_BDEBA|nr:translation elongation factor Ts [Bdellovibrio bacteriovorus]P61331.1 RecName: Full=Elongation factor Ts; Short=EF-Ts [Bdellovibrio bacteriovorus HD100]AHZ85537.1 elongation factor Ts [Bdellovibrio bacteriovorus]BEV70084.1 Elongation factor Ts [Bdellovibrio bacteriovorus]CAE81142.1 elongation factor EF-Ts [Bdellovibrio bacteriovorus HD100]
MSISATLVKELREKTNAGMMDCKKALEATSGDFNAAVEWLRVKGLGAAAKKADRIAAEGAVFAELHGNTGVVIEINSETDFVARNDGFKALAANVVSHLAKTNLEGDVLAQAYAADSSKKLGDLFTEATATIGEKIVLRRQEKYTATATSLVHTYLHGEGKIGVMIEVGASKPEAVSNPALKTFAQDVALHIAAMNPMAISSEQIPADVVSKEKEILTAKNLESGKKPEMIEKIVEGQIRKFLAENCLLDQPFVKNPDMKVSDLAKSVGKEIGADVTVKRFVRFELGAGIEKKTNDFAAEVAAQMKGH